MSSGESGPTLWCSAPWKITDGLWLPSCLISWTLAHASEHALLSFRAYVLNRLAFVDEPRHSSSKCGTVRIGSTPTVPRAQQPTPARIPFLLRPSPLNSAAWQYSHSTASCCPHPKRSAVLYLVNSIRVRPLLLPNSTPPLTRAWLCTCRRPARSAMDPAPDHPLARPPARYRHISRRHAVCIHRVYSSTTQS
jgi:hypothetical protein